MNTTTIKRKFKDLLVQERKARDLKQKEVAGVLDVKLPRYQAWEEGRAEPNLDTLVKFRRMYGEAFLEKLFQ